MGLFNMLGNPKKEESVMKPKRKYVRSGKYSKKATIPKETVALLRGKPKRKYVRSGKYANKSNGSVSHLNGKGLTADNLIALLKNAKLGRGWKGKIRAVVDPETHVKWSKSVEERSVSILATEGEARLVLTKKGEIKVYSNAGYKSWKKGMKNGLKAIHGPGVNA